MACSTGDACGLTDTRSSGRRWLNHSSVMIDTSDADDAWCPPTFSPSGLGRTRLAWCTIDVASHNTRCSTSRSVASRSMRPPSSARRSLHHRGPGSTMPAGSSAVDRYEPDVFGDPTPATSGSRGSWGGGGGFAATGAGGAVPDPDHQLGRPLLRVP